MPITHWLVYVDERTGLGRTFALKPPGPLAIGRAPDSAIRIDGSFPGSAAVSMHHALLHWEDGVGWLLRDRGSTNGTYVDGLRSGYNVLRPGCTVAFAQVRFRFLDRAVLGRMQGDADRAVG